MNSILNSASVRVTLFICRRAIIRAARVIRVREFSYAASRIPALTARNCLPRLTDAAPLAIMRRVNLIGCSNNGDCHSSTGRALLRFR